jgi:hypothetical protein
LNPKPNPIAFLFYKDFLHIDIARDVTGAEAKNSASHLRPCFDNPDNYEVTARNQMGKYDKVLFRMLRGMSDANIAFDDLRQLLLRLGFE